MLRRLVHALARQAVGEQRRRQLGGSTAGIIMPILVIAALVALAMYLAPVLFHAH